MFDASGNLYVPDLRQLDRDQIRRREHDSQHHVFHRRVFSNNLAVDSSGSLYVLNSSTSSVNKFAPGSTVVSATYTAGLSNPYQLAFDSSGNLYVVNEGNSTVVKFAAGSVAA